MKRCLPGALAAALLCLSLAATPEAAAPTYVNRLGQTHKDVKQGLPTDYTSPGPFPVTFWSGTLEVVIGERLDLAVIVTFPKEPPRTLQTLPVVFMFNGFELQAGSYNDTVRWVASWQYVVVQYTVPGLLHPLLLTDREELQVLNPLCTYVEQLAADPASPFYGLPDMNQAAVMGHSRGGKLATLHWAGVGPPPGPGMVAPVLRAAVLLDPVDSSFGVEYPSAVSALAAANKQVAVAGANVTSLCNPTSENYENFYKASAAGSWRMIIYGAGHMQFLIPGKGTRDEKLARLCRHGKQANQVVISMASTLATAWLEQTFRGNEVQVAQRLAATLEWLQPGAPTGCGGNCTFNVKP